MTTNSKEMKSLTRWVENRPLFVLVVDDDEYDRLLVVRELARTDYDCRCIEMTNGVDAIRFLDSGGRADVAFIDISMPHMDGWELMRQIRAKHDIVTCAIYTGSANDIPAAKVESAGAVCLISKPPTLESLRQLLKDIRV